jgi:hypothetical protein
MKRIAIVATAALTLAGCGHFSTANWTPEQRAAYLAQLQRSLTEQQALNQRNYEIQMQSISAWGASNRPQQPTNCTTTYVGNQAYTHCQ